jgi:hypothetical protein
MPWVDSYYPREVRIGMSAVPSTSTQLTSVDTEVHEINVANVTSAGITFTVTAGDGNTLIPAFTVPAATETIPVYNATGELCRGGVSWQAASSGLIAELNGRRLTGWSDGNGVNNGVSKST